MDEKNNVFGTDPTPTPSPTVDLSGVEEKLGIIAENIEKLTDAISLLSNPIFATTKDILASTNLEYCGKSVRDVIYDGLVNSERLIEEYNNFVDDYNRHKSDDKKMKKINYE